MGQLEERRVPSTLVTLASFNNTNGANPYAALMVDSSGDLFGTAYNGGANGYGAVFELAHGSNTINLLASFNGSNGAYPSGSLIEDSSGNLFGTTFRGGANNVGTVFELAHGSNTINVLVSFNGSNGATPYAGLIEDSNGNLFGTAQAGGPNNVGTVFELAHGSSTITTLASFNYTNGATPTGSLVEDGSGNLFGTTSTSGANGYGTVFELAHGGNTITTLASFNLTNGATPYGGLVEDASGNLFGTTQSGGANNDGTVFELAQGSHTITTLATFNGSNGVNPRGTLVDDSNGNLFGTTNTGGANGVGTVFELAHGGSTITTLASFNNTNGAVPYAGLIEDSSGNLFGVTYAGGANNDGTVFELDQGPSISTQPQNASATVGQAASVSLTVAARGGTAPLSYQWQISTDNGGTFTNLSNGSGVAGATATTLSVSGFAHTGSAEYRAIVTDANNVSASSNAMTLTINDAPAITTQPHNATATVGQSASEFFTIADSGGTGSLTFQWQISTNNGGSFSNLSNGSGVTGANTANLTLSGFATAGSAEYRALATDANGVTATSNAATLTINAAPSITAQPQNATATVGQSASESFTIADSGGTAPLTVQWRISTDNGSTFTNLSNGSGVAGATTTSLTVSGFTTAGSPKYQAIVTDANGVTATSNAATLTINAAPSPTDPNQSWLAQVYADFFNRALDPSGLTTWSNLLGQGVSRTQVVQLIQSNLAYRTDVVEALYAKLLHRPADASGLNAFTSFLGNGGTTAHVEAALLGSLEYVQLQGGTNNSFLSAVYQDVLNRALDGSGAQSWGLQLAGGSTPMVVARAILASLESETDEVQGLFNEFLHRAADPSGLNSFTMALQQGVPTEEVIAGIVGSDEYFARARADIIYSNFGPGQTYQPGGYSVSGGQPPGSQPGPPTGYGFAIALSFTPRDNFLFSSVKLPLVWYWGINAFTVNLMSDAGGHPGTILESFSLTNAPSNNSPAITSFISTKDTPLNAGTTYWIAAMPVDRTTAGFWVANSTGASGFSRTGNDGLTWSADTQASPALEVDGHHGGQH